MSDDDVRQQVEHPTALPKKSRYARWMTFVLFGGVFLPAAAIVVELTTRICSSIFFDPIPTGWHLALLLLVPLTNLGVIGVHLRGGTNFASLLTFLIGVSIGTGFIYSLSFLIVAPFSVFAVLAYGLGLLGLSPYFEFAATIICGSRLAELQLISKRRHKKMLWTGISAGAVVLALFLVAIEVTDVGMRMASSPDEATSRRGVRLLRTFGSRKALLRACYGLPSDGLVSYGQIMRGPWDSDIREKARTTYYRVTGAPFNSEPPPKMVGLRSELTSDFETDLDVGGTAVNGIVPSLSLSSSRVDGVVYPDEMVGYTEWTMVFTNSSFEQKEARAELALPPGGVVSRLTLWVNGEPREAAFGGRGQVREAYQEVAVVQRRDPVLVTTSGPDRVLMQCFPVPPNGGTMKVRIGVTSPLAPVDGSQALYTLPRFIERNFSMPDGIGHSLFVDSPQRISFSKPSTKETGRIVTTITDDELARGKNTIMCGRNSSITQVWTPDKLDPKDYAVLQTLTSSVVMPPRNVIIVIDGSKSVAPSRDDIAEAISSLPSKTSFSVVVAGDEVTELLPMHRFERATLRSVQGRIRTMRCVGGIDNRSALIKAWDSATQQGDTAIVWIHGPQPLKSESLAEQLQQRLERQIGAGRIYAIAAADGRNTVLADLEQSGQLTVIPRRGKLSDDLRQLFETWRADGQPSLSLTRERVPQSSVKNAARASSHIRRLWVLGEVMGICRRGDSRATPEATRLAADYQLVTPVSGAVVLETEQQYKDAGLKSVDPTTVPSSVPEPGTWAVLIIGVAVMAVHLCKEKVKSRAITARRM